MHQELGQKKYFGGCLAKVGSTITKPKFGGECPFGSPSWQHH